MAVQGQDEALAAMKRVWENVNPDPAPTPVGIWTYPKDHLSISTGLSTFPVIIISEVVNSPNQWLFDANDLSESRWAIEVLAFFQFGPVTTEPQASEAEKLHRPWPKALADTLFLYHDLYKTVFKVGVPGNKLMFDWRTGNIDFWAKVFWGIRFVIPVSQSHGH